MVSPVLTVFKNSSPKESIAIRPTLFQTFERMTPEAAKGSIGIEKSQTFGDKSLTATVWMTIPPVVEPMV